MYKAIWLKVEAKKHNFFLLGHLKKKKHEIKFQKNFRLALMILSVQNNKGILSRKIFYI